LLLIPAAGAIAAGNAVVLKPSEVSSETSRVLAKIVPQYFTDKAIAIVEGGVQETTELLKQKFDHIFYTGNGTVGRIVMHAAAENLTPVTLELGGKSPTIVDASANIAVAARRIAWAKYVNAGQTCVAPDYVLAHKSIANELVEAIRKSITEFYGDDPHASKDYSRVISPRHFSRLASLISSGKVAIGGQTEQSERYIAPTVLVDVTQDSAVMQEEIFGPILPVITIAGLEAGLQQVRSRSKPLALYLFSNDKAAQRRTLQTTSSGSVCFNDVVMQAGATALPFGGVGESGLGSYHGRAGFLTFSHQRSVLERPFWLDLPFRYPPYKGKLGLVKRLLG
jgi:aldehyde dehydrogenase (NAD+)